ncbi:MAG: TniQ family protein [Lachnospiraceae bacterium]|nr:TniQ family protein [Lachnospiraceae bacterium]MDE7203161.1 TniQ family protein [Lachnospiraceae bacterium]
MVLDWFSLHILQSSLCRIKSKAHHLFAILPRTEDNQWLKYCPLCAGEDRERYGETYWHRRHQIRNMNVCTRHKCRLKSSKVPAKSELCIAKIMFQM